MTQSHRRRFAAAAAIVTGLGLVTTISGSAPASANFPGTGGGPTASNYSTISGVNLNPQWCETTCESLSVGQASWSPDGSRAIFVDQHQRVMSVRWDDEYDVTVLVDTPDDATVQRDYPIYVGAGDRIAWTESDSATPSHLMAAGAGLGSGPGGLSGPVKINDLAFRLDSRPDGKVVFDNLSEIWVWDGLGTDASNFTKLVNGTDASFSPDGTKIAYNMGSFFYTANADGSNSQPLTVDVDGSNPVWSSDGSTIYFNYSSTVRSVPSSGGTSTWVNGLTGYASYRPARADKVLRLAGSSRFGTATAVSQSYWATAGAAADTRKPAQSVILSRSDNFADALGGAALASAKQGPLLLTPPTTLDATTSAEITRVLGDNASAMVYLLGGTGALSTTVENQIHALGYQTTRLAGANRFETAISIANAIDPNPDMILAATGANFPDALAAGATAGSFDTPGSDLSAVVVLTDDKTLPAVTKKYLDARVSNTVPVVAIGGQARTATSSYGANQGYIVGPNRYATAAIVAEIFFANQRYAGVATGTDWPDALAGGALLGTLNSPLLLTPGLAKDLDPWTGLDLSDSSASVSTALVLGGTGVVNGAQMSQIGVVIGGSAGSTQATNGQLGTGFIAGTASAPLTASAGHRTVRDILDAINALNG